MVWDISLKNYEKALFLLIGNHFHEDQVVRKGSLHELENYRTNNNHPLVKVFFFLPQRY
jgi:hypothetical protein